MQWEIMDMEALSVLQLIIAVNLMPLASAFNLVQSLVASVAHNADFFLFLSFKRHS